MNKYKIKHLYIICFHLLPISISLSFYSCNKGEIKSNSAQNTVSHFKTGGYIGERLTANEKSWLHSLLVNNPNMFGAFLHPESNNLFKCMWHGEFPGKILTGLGQTYLASHDPNTLIIGNKLVALLGESQWEDGYLGPWSSKERFDNPPEKWDTWGHYHCMYGLWQWYKLTGEKEALAIACRAADCIYAYFIEGDISFASQNWGECNFAISHIMAILYQETGNEKYLETAKHIVHKEWKTPYHDFYTNKTLTCDWLDATLEGKAFCHSNQKRWESLYTLATLATLYQITNNESYYNAMESLWWGIIKFDRHNTGSFGTGEGADGDIYGMGSETCNTVAWMTFSTEYLKLCKNSYVADELEFSFFNAALGSQLGDKEFVYMNSSDGKRISSQIELAPHSYEGGREMNCCQANGNRGISQYTQWGLLTDYDNLYLNYYGESEIAVYYKKTPVVVKQQTDYPKNGIVTITLEPQKRELFTLNLRIPIWSKNTKVKVNGIEQSDVRPGEYYPIKKRWNKGDTIELELDMSIHYWVGDGLKEGKTSLYYGPILLSIREDTAHLNPVFKKDSFKDLQFQEKEGHWFYANIPTSTGQIVAIEDYATKPSDTEYTTWLTIETDLPAIPFSRNGKPVWNNR